MRNNFKTLEITFGQSLNYIKLYKIQNLTHPEYNSNYCYPITDLWPTVSHVGLNITYKL